MSAPRNPFPARFGHGVTTPASTPEAPNRQVQLSQGAQQTPPAHQPADAEQPAAIAPPAKRFNANSQNATPPVLKKLKRVTNESADQDGDPDDTVPNDCEASEDNNASKGSFKSALIDYLKQYEPVHDTWAIQLWTEHFATTSDQPVVRLPPSALDELNVKNKSLQLIAPGRPGRTMLTMLVFDAVCEDKAAGKKYLAVKGVAQGSAELAYILSLEQRKDDLKEDGDWRVLPDDEADELADAIAKEEEERYQAMMKFVGALKRKSAEVVE